MFPIYSPTGIDGTYHSLPYRVESAIGILGFCRYSDMNQIFLLKLNLLYYIIRQNLYNLQRLDHNFTLSLV
jgi:hypothetical protein